MERPENENKISRENFEILKSEWVALDMEYDNLFTIFLDNPGVMPLDKIKKFKAMQKRLYAIEDQLYKIAEGKLSIK